MIEIEKNVPMPIKRRRKSDFPLEKMNVGDSFVFVGQASKPRQAATKYGKKSGKVFATRKESINGFEGVRVWRIS